MTAGLWRLTSINWLTITCSRGYKTLADRISQRERSNTHPSIAHQSRDVKVLHMYSFQVIQKSSSEVRLAHARLASKEQARTEDAGPFKLGAHLLPAESVIRIIWLLIHGLLESGKLLFST